MARSQDVECSSSAIQSQAHGLGQARKLGSCIFSFSGRRNRPSCKFQPHGSRWMPSWWRHTPPRFNLGRSIGHNLAASWARPGGSDDTETVGSLKRRERCKCCAGEPHTTEPTPFLRREDGAVIESSSCMGSDSADAMFVISDVSSKNRRRMLCIVRCSA